MRRRPVSYSRLKWIGVGLTSFRPFTRTPCNSRRTAFGKGLLRLVGGNTSVSTADCGLIYARCARVLSGGVS